MARIVKRTKTGPKEVEVPGGEPIYVCQCGLSRKQPFCDGTHKLTLDEQPGKLYQYDKSGRRKEIADTFGDIATF